VRIGKPSEKQDLFIALSFKQDVLNKAWLAPAHNDLDQFCASRSTSRQPMSRRQNPLGKSIASTAA